MKLTGNTIFITGGGSGIGRGLAEALHQRGNQVIISGRRKANLDETTAANPGMQSVEVDVEDPKSIEAVAKKLMAEYPKLNVLINNAGLMKAEGDSGVVDEAILMTTITTNLIGPIRMTNALLDHLKAQPSAAVINVTSGLAFAPLAPTSVYCATKAGLHSFTLSLRYKLKESSVKVLELAPPYVQTDLLNGKDDPRAMPLNDFITEVTQVLGTDVEEVLVERVKPLRNNPGPGEWAFVKQMNDMMAASYKS